ncbi:MAG: nucleotidyltransferase domain-containing protein [Bacteroidota bacterium]
MSKKEIILHKIISVINKNASDAEVYLYGSQAKGNAKKLSDWDLLILLNRPVISFDLETKLLDDFYDLELETSEIISPLIYTKSDWINNYSITPLFENIKNEGIKLR